MFPVAAAVIIYSLSPFLHPLLVVSDVAPVPGAVDQLALVDDHLFESLG